jgi:uncharacterized protein (TIGR04141 family)
MVKKTNKLSIYLIREKYKDFSLIIKDPSIGQVIIDPDTHFYYAHSIITEPKWLNSFFGKTIDDGHRKNMKASGVQAVLLVKIKNKRIFALTFGYGRFLIHDYTIEERFGLKTTLNTLNQNSIRHIEKRTLSKNPKISREQIAKASEATDFNLDIERDLIEAITGKSDDIRFGKVVTGKDSLNVSVKVDITSVKAYLEDCLSKYNSKAYQAGFKWIDQIEYVKDSLLIEKIDNKLVDEINKNGKEVWMSLPEMIDWENHAGFKYSERKSDDLVDEIELSEWLSLQTGKVSVDDLKNSNITVWTDGGDRIEDRWSVYKCLYAELMYRSKMYFLTDAKWYVVDVDYVKSVNDYFKAIPWENLKLPNYNHTDENAYNKAITIKVKGHLLDAKNLQYGGGSSKVEFCDVLTPEKQMLYVKKYTGSSAMSHLFNQGHISGELLVSDEKFRQELSDKILPSKAKSLIPLKKFDANKYHIIFAIIHKNAKNGKVGLPFFSKVALRRVHKLLTAFRFKVSLYAVKNIKP